MALNISSDLVPQVINDYNAYTEDDLLIGLADEITLPKIKNKTTSVSGMGIAGEVDSPVPGQFESMEATLNWNTMYSYATKMMNPNKNIQITLRAAMQNDNKNGGYTYKGLRVVLGGRPKELDPGKLKRADTMGSTTTLEVTRYLMEVDGQTVIDIDKFAGRYYDASCNGVWVVMKDIYTTSTFGNSNSYKDSSIHSYLNSTFYNLIDSNIRAAIKQVKIPYTNSGVQSGANGLSTKVFLLSGTEVGLSASYMNTEGVKLSYFDSASKRVAYNGSSAAEWWLRSPHTDYSNGVWTVGSDGSGGSWSYYFTCGVRPAFVLPSELVVSDDGTVSTNTAPAIAADSTSLGEKNAPFNFNYTVTDADGDTLTVTEKLDGKTTATRTGVASGTALTFGQGSTAENFQRILNGSHTIQITASDGKESTTVSATFTKSVTAATVTLTTPLAVDGDITVAVLQVTGSIPEDATFKAEVTNNALDDSPVWQDVTTEVQKGVNIVFSNKTAANGAAFNFRISVARGASGTGGYIEAISGAFQ